jgi:hypothetical protein
LSARAAGPNPATISIGVSPTPIIQGQPVTISITVSGAVGTATGGVKLSIDGTTTGTPVNLAGGSATFALTSCTDVLTLLPTGNHQIGVLYTGDVNYQAQTPNVNQKLFPVVNPSRLISVSPSSGSIVFGESEIYTATVTSCATGTVNFFDGAAQLNASPVALSGNQAQFGPTPLTTIGSHSITAQYSGDAYFPASTSSPATVTLNKANTSTALSSTQTSSSFTFSATVSVVAPGAGTPAGSVQFFNGSTSIGTVSLSNNKAQLTVSPLFGNVTATYSGDGNFNSSASSALTIAQPQASLSVTSSKNPATYGDNLTFTATLAVTSGVVAPTGSVQFADSTTVFGTAPLNGNQATLQTNKLVPGSHAIVVTYSGDASFATQSTTMGQVVNKGLTTTTLNSSSSGPSVTLSAAVNPTVSGVTPGPTGQVTFFEGPVNLGSATLVNGQASLAASFAAGRHTVTATYAGDSLWATSTSAGSDIDIGAAGISITTTSLPPGTLGSPYSASIQVSGGTQPYTYSITGLPPGLQSTDGVISGTPTQDGTFPVAVSVTDKAGATASSSLSITITVASLTITTSSLPNANLNTAYTTTLAASGGIPGSAGYQWSLLSTSDSNATLSPAGVLSGTFTTAGNVSLNVQVKDSKGTTASAQLTLTVVGQQLSITTPSLPSGTYGSSYNASVSATGGQTPYTFSGTFPDKLSIDAKTGAISGTPNVAGNATLAVTVTDAAGGSTSRSYTVAFAAPPVSSVSFGSPGDTANAMQQPLVALSLSSPYPLPITGTTTLTFQPDTGFDDPAVQFSNGVRVATFTIPANSTNGVFTASNLAVQTGTVAGLITLTTRLVSSGVELTPAPAPKTIRINPTAPVIVGVQATRTSGGLSIVVSGFSTPREVTQALFHFSQSASGNLQTSDVTVPVTSAFSGWYQSTASQPFGSQFTFTQTFTVTGDTQAVSSVGVTLVNSKGNSSQVTANLQ